MAGKQTDPTRSRMMAAVRQRGTKPELAVRRCLRRMGYRYRSNVKSLPGSPDIVIPKESIAILVHGCFWHRHRCRFATTPKTNQSFWLEKFEQNRRRDRRVKRQLRKERWRVIVIWECWTRDTTRLEEKLIGAILKTS